MGYTRVGGVVVVVKEQSKSTVLINSAYELVGKKGRESFAISSDRYLTVSTAGSPFRRTTTIEDFSPSLTFLGDNTARTRTAVQIVSFPYSPKEPVVSETMRTVVNDSWGDPIEWVEEGQRTSREEPHDDDVGYTIAYLDPYIELIQTVNKSNVRDTSSDRIRGKAVSMEYQDRTDRLLRLARQNGKATVSQTDSGRTPVLRPLYSAHFNIGNSQVHINEVRLGINRKQNHVLYRSSGEDVEPREYSIGKDGKLATCEFELVRTFSPASLAQTKKIMATLSTLSENHLVRE